jgi:hypothetical protein
MRRSTHGTYHEAVEKFGGREGPFASVKFQDKIMDARIKRGAPVMWFNYMATVEQFTQSALVFGRVLGVGQRWVTIRTEFGGIQRLRPDDMSLCYSADGENILKKKGI